RSNRHLHRCASNRLRASPWGHDRWGDSVHSYRMANPGEMECWENIQLGGQKSLSPDSAPEHSKALTSSSRCSTTGHSQAIGRPSECVLGWKAVFPIPREDGLCEIRCHELISFPWRY